MNKTYRNSLMWLLYAALFLAVMLVQTVVFGRMRFFGAKIDLLPVAVVCISMHVGHEAGALFTLLAALVWTLTGADGGALCLVTFTGAAILSGYLCDAVYARKFIPALFLSLGALLLHECAMFLLKYYLSGAELSLFRWPLITTGLSLPACPVIYLLAKAIRKAGDA